MPEPPKSYVEPGILTRAEDPWCNDCMKSSMWEGWAWLLSIRGVTRWGTCRGCDECGQWIYTNLKGEVKYVKHWGPKTT